MRRGTSADTLRRHCGDSVNDIRSAFRRLYHVLTACRLHPHRGRSRRGARRADAADPRFARWWRRRGGRRCGGGLTALPGSPQSSCRSSFRPRARARSGAGLPRPSIRSSPRPFCGRAPHGWRGSACRRRKSNRSRKSPAPSARGDLALASLGDMPADAAHAALTAVHGIGPWTADIYLLSCLGHADAWPAGDLALQEAARLAFGLRARPTAKEMTALAEAWRPLARAWRRACCGPIIAPSKDVKARPSDQDPAESQENSRKKEARMAAELDGPKLDGPSLMGHGLSRAPAPRDSLSSSCMAMAPTATT